MNPVCWICLSSEELLTTPCRCTSRPAHASCLATWRAFKTGTPEERACRFCGVTYSESWTAVIRPVIDVRVGRRTKTFGAVADAADFREKLEANFGIVEPGARDLRLEISPAGTVATGWDALEYLFSSSANVAVAV
jgi:hypothetical protein